jgi:hypothetical protein
MFRRLFAVLFAIAAAILGAVIGRAAADLRRKSEAGEALHVEMDVASLRPRDVMPGLVAALRVHDRPWSYLHVPSWVAAFSVNFAFAALARELGPLFGALRGDDDTDGTYPTSNRSGAWPYESAPATSPARSDAAVDPL